MLKRYNDILNEKKDIKAEKSAIEEKINKLFKEKPVIKGSNNWPDASCIYGLSSIKKYVGGDTMKVDQVFNDMRKDKKIKTIKVKILAYNETYPYFYHEDYTTKEEAEKCKAEMEKSQNAEKKTPEKPREAPARKVAKKKDVEAKPPRKPREKKAPTEGEAKAKAKVTIRRKK